MKKSYIVTSLVTVGLIVSVAFAGDIELNDDADKDLQVKSSIQLSEKISEADEVKAAKVSVSEVITTLKAQFSGKITKVELENEDGNLVYTSEIFQDSGQTLDIVIDAGDGEILVSSIDKPDHDDEEDDEKGEEKED